MEKFYINLFVKFPFPRIKPSICTRFVRNLDNGVSNSLFIPHPLFEKILGKGGREKRTKVGVGVEYRRPLQIFFYHVELENHSDSCPQ